MRVPASVIESRRATRQRQIAATFALLVLSLVGVVLHFTDASASPKREKAVRYIVCAPGGVHAWVTPEGGIAVLPAGTECPK